MGKPLFLGLILLSFSLCPALAQTDQENEPSSIRQIESITVNCAYDDCDSIFKEFSSAVRLKQLVIRNLNSNAVAQQINNLPQLERLEMIDCPMLNFNKLFRNLNASNLRSLVLDSNKLTEIPEQIGGFGQLRSLTCRYNEVLFLNRSASTIGSLNRLERLDLSYNNIDEVPNDVSSWEGLESVNLSYNNISSLPWTVNVWENLEELDLRENLLSNPYREITGMENLPLKKVVIDREGINGIQEDQLYDKFPNTEFIFWESTDEAPEAEVTDTAAVIRDLTAADDPPPKAIPVKSSNDTQYGQFSTGDNEFAALSTAYVHYPEIFGGMQYKYTFDTLLFDERYKDSSYANVWKIQPLEVYDRIGLEKFKKGEKGEVWFRFQTGSKRFLVADRTANTTKYLNKNNAEVNAFRGMAWIYQGELSPKKFKKAYLKKSRWMDVRIYFNHEATNFVIELKSKNGFDRITAYPRYTNLQRTLEMAQETYEKRYVRYSKSLDRRKSRFHKSLNKSKVRYEYQLKKSRTQAWNSFRRTYMSPEELTMTKAEWMIYYDKVVANEQRALDNAPLSMKNLGRSLNLSEYREVSRVAGPTSYNDLRYPSVIFDDGTGNRLAVKAIMVIGPELQEFSVHDGALGVKANKLFLHPTERRDLVLELHNGDMAVVTWANLSSALSESKRSYRIEAEVISEKLGHIGLIRSKLAL